MWETVYIISSLDRITNETRQLVIAGIILFTCIAFYMLIKKEKINFLIAIIIAMICFITYKNVIPNLPSIKEREYFVELAKEGEADYIIEGEGIVDNSSLRYNEIIIDGKEYIIRLEDISPKIPNDAELYKLYLKEVTREENEDLVIRVDAYYSIEKA